LADDQELITGDLQVAGWRREFILRLPRGRAPEALVLILHGNHPEARGSLMREWTTFDQQADTWGFAVAYPDGHSGSWADGRGVSRADEAGVDDVAFLRAVIDWSADRFGTYRDRAIVAGMSNGAFMAHRMALEASDQVAVLAAVSGQMPASLLAATPSHAVSAMLIHGTADSISPIEGGYSRHRAPRADASDRAVEPAHLGRGCRRDEGGRMGGARRRAHLARNHAAARVDGAGYHGVRRSRGDLPFRQPGALPGGQAQAVGTSSGGYPPTGPGPRLTTTSARTSGRS
jgi:polyhydroxybutyrate depolymerase